jgi:hypothetical protein
MRFRGLPHFGVTKGLGQCAGDPPHRVRIHVEFARTTVIWNLGQNSEELRGPEWPRAATHHVEVRSTRARRSHRQRSRRAESDGLAATEVSRESD